MKIKISFLVLATLLLFQFADAQEYVAQKNSIGISGGSLTYFGRYSVDATLASHSSLYAAGFFRRRIYDRTYIRAEGMVGRLRADNREVDGQSSKPQGYFQTEIGEATIRGEYEFVNLYARKFSPYILAGAGVYALNNYESTNGFKLRKEKFGFVVPVGGGVKYKINDRFKLIAEGNIRFFTKNLDNYTGEGVNNPNKFFSAGIGLIYELEPFNSLW